MKQGDSDMKKIATLALCVLMLALTAPVIQAATPQAGAPKADKPAKVDARSTPVWVELEGTDSIGARLGMRLKEAFNGSNLFSLTDKDMPKMRLLVSTQSEFPGRPGVGSVYSICWTFTQGEGYLGYLLAMCIIREFLGGGTFGGGVLGAVNEAGQHVGIQIFPADYGIGMLTLPVGGFLVLAALIAAMQWALARPKKDKEESK